MKRRGVLGAAGCLLSTFVTGCISDQQTEDRRTTATSATQTTATKTATGTTTTTAQTTSQTSTTRQTTLPPPTADNLSINARVTQSSPKESPPRVAVELTNPLDHDIVVEGGATVPFSSYWSTEGDLIAVPDDRRYVGTPGDDGLIPASRDGCWRVRSNIVVAAIGRQLALGPGERTTTRFSVLAGSSTTDCPGGGSYRFENTIRVYDGRAEPGSRSGRKLVLEFTIERTPDSGIASVSQEIRPPRSTTTQAGVASSLGED